MLIIQSSFDKSLEEQEGEIKKIFRKSSLKFTFRQSDCRKSDFARPKSKAFWSNLPRLDLVVFNNNFA